MDFLQADLGVDISQIGPETPLLSSGVIDSFSLLTLLSFLEERGGFRVNPADMTLENLDTVERMLAFAKSESTAK
tara:strand:- start:5427 stop:5651 length:225 start_codon:yes stop_codon:yes gene_type:complete